MSNIIWSDTGLLGISTRENLSLYKIQKDQFEEEKELTEDIRKIVKKEQLIPFKFEFLDQDSS